MLVTVMINHLRGLVSALEGNTVYAQHMHTYIPTYAYIHTYICIHTYLHMLHTYLHMHTYIPTYVTYIPTYAYIRSYTCTYMVAVASLIPRLFLLAWE